MAYRPSANLQKLIYTTTGTICYYMRQDIGEWCWRQTSPLWADVSFT